MQPVERSLGPSKEAGLRSRIDALAPWFYNIELGGIWTAPDHFLGNSGFTVEQRLEDEVCLCRTARRPYENLGPAVVYPAAAPATPGAVA